MNPGSYEHGTCSESQLIPYNFRAYKYLKIEVWTKVVPYSQIGSQFVEKLPLHGFYRDAVRLQGLAPGPARSGHSRTLFLKNRSAQFVQTVVLLI